MTTPQRRFSVSSIRPKLMFETASEMVERSDWPYRNARVTVRDQGGEHDAVYTFMGTQDPGVIEQVARGEVQVAMLNPSAMLTLAVRGTGPFSAPQPLAAIAVIPSDDQFAFAVTEASGITSLAQIRDERKPIRVSIRGAHDPSTAMLGNEVLKAHGFTLDDIESWGGHVSYDQALPGHPTRLGRVESGELDAIFDEAVPNWANRAAGMGMRLLPVEGDAMKTLVAAGFRASVIPKEKHPNLPADVPAIDFSGWPIYTHAEAPDEFVTAFCEALDARKDRVPWEESGEVPLPLARMVHDAPDAPLKVLFHPAAERVWRALGYL
jgi:TRAP-type uncharacterized transport system substrate-binding protein